MSDKPMTEKQAARILIGAALRRLQYIVMDANYHDLLNQRNPVAVKASKERAELIEAIDSVSEIAEPTKAMTVDIDRYRRKESLYD